MSTDGAAIAYSSLSSSARVRVRPSSISQPRETGGSLNRFMIRLSETDRFGALPTPVAVLRHVGDAGLDRVARRPVAHDLAADPDRPAAAAGGR